MFPVIFVVIPAYNAEQFLRESVNSVLNQPYKNIKVVIVNDGSKDNTGNICDDLAMNSDRVNVVHQSNSGVSVARNNGLKYILDNKFECDYIIFLDADDFWLDNALTEDIASSFNDFDIIGMSDYVSNNNGMRFKIGSIPVEKQIIKVEKGIDEWPTGHLGTYFIKASNIKSYNLFFQNNLKRNEDYIFKQELFLCSRCIKFFSKPFYVYRMNHQSVTHTAKISLDNINDVLFGWYKAKRFVDSIEELSDNIKKKWNERCEVMIGTILLENAMNLAMNGFSSKQIEKAIYNNPLLCYYELLAYEQLHDWHKKPYRMLNNNIKTFVFYYRLKGICIYFIQRLSKNRLLYKLTEKIRYPLLKTDILR